MTQEVSMFATVEQLIGDHDFLQCSEPTRPGRAEATLPMLLRLAWRAAIVISCCTCMIQVRLGG